MKIRIRFSQRLSEHFPGHRARSVDLTGGDGEDIRSSPDEVTLADLKKAVCDHIVSVGIDCLQHSLNEGANIEDAWKHVVVSLGGHGHQPLVSPQEAARRRVTHHDARVSGTRLPTVDEDICGGDHTTSLQSLGVISGDTIYVLSFPGSEERTSQTPIDMPMIYDDKTIPVIEERDPFTSGPGGMLPSVLQLIQEGIWERHLEDKLTRNDAITLIIHAALIEYGFDCCNTLDDIVGPVCKENPCVYQIRYLLQVEHLSNKCLECLLHVSMQHKSVMMTMKISSGKLITKLLKLPSEEYDRGPENVKQQSLWNQALGWNHEQCFQFLTSCKDDFCRHALSLSCAQLDIEYPGACLAMMPAEVKRKILGFLDFDDLCSVGMTCRELCMQHRDNTLWISLLDKYFSNHDRDTQEESRVYGTCMAKHEFKRLLLAQREKDALMKRRHVSQHAIPWAPPPPVWGQPRPRFPGIIGGDYDRVPSGLPSHTPSLPMIPRARGGHHQWRLE